ncbi:MAG: class I SAM-dependent methyltransferase [Woeseia sp.]
MRKLFNKLLLKFGYLITKAPRILSEQSVDSQEMLPAELTEKVRIGEATETPDDELFHMFATDTDVHKWHHYFDIYARHFEAYRSGPVRMLEIGVFRGGSLRMWKKYFHPDSVIVGIDIDKNCRQHEIADQDVYVRIGSQADPDFLAAVNREFGPFDIILDDGSHKTYHQLVSFTSLFRNALKDGGCYLVEDMHTNYWTSHVDTPQSFIEVSKQMVDMLHEPYLGRKEIHFRHEHPEAVSELTLSYLAAHLSGIAFYDSIIVFDKKLKALPKSEQR